MPRPCWRDGLMLSSMAGSVLQTCAREPQFPCSGSKGKIVS